MAGWLKAGVVNKARKYGRIRKHEEKKLPAWKSRWLRFNKKHLGWLESFVETLIPWLVIILFFLIVGEISHKINIFHWGWLELAGNFFEEHEAAVDIFDKIIISFFIVDIYFNFFRKKTVWKFVKTSFLDILAVAPLGLFLRLSGLSEAQAAVHIAAEVEKEASKIVRSEEAVVSASRVLREAEEASRLSRSSRLYNFFRKLPRLFRLYRVVEVGESEKAIKKKARKTRRRLKV